MYSVQRPDVGPTARVQGRVFHDRDADGTRDAGEGGVREVAAVFLDRNGNGMLDFGQYRDPPGEDGRYALDVPPGECVPGVAFTAGSGARITTASLSLGAVEAGGTYVRDLGVHRPGTVRGVVFNDANGDGVRHSDDPP
jgi:hypothetical protein